MIKWAPFPSGRKEFAKLLASQEWGSKTKRYALSREEEYVGALRGALGIW